MDEKGTLRGNGTTMKVRKPANRTERLVEFAGFLCQTNLVTLSLPISVENLAAS